MGVFTGIRSAVDDMIVGASKLNSNRAVTEIKGLYGGIRNSPKLAAGYKTAKNVSKAVASDLGRVKGASIALGTTVGGGAIGYLGSDDRHKFRGTLMGGGLGLAAGVGTVGLMGGRGRAALNSTKGFAKGMYGDTKSWLNAAPSRQARTAATKEWNAYAKSGFEGPASAVTGWNPA